MKHLYSIMPLLEGYEDEIAADIVRQYTDGVATEALFSMALTPEGDPVIDKAALFSKTYLRYQRKLAERGYACGILVQATIGHGYPLTTPIPFTPVVGLTDGQKKYTACPYDEAFRSYIRRAMQTLAKTNPTTIMVDDDFRLVGRAYLGCACPLHMKEVSRRLGREITREELLALAEQNTPEGRHVMQVFYDTQVDSLIGAAHAMREGIDAVNPALQGAFCVCSDLCEGGREIASVLAGKGNPVIVRVNNGKYCAPGARDITVAVARAATQMHLMAGADVFLAETDTCPQNRYSTAASSLHTHFTASILEGAAGCKHWITRMRAYEPKSGEAYRRKLSHNAGFYRTLSKLVPTVRWTGARIPLADKPWIPTPPLSKFRQASEETAFASCVLERMGLPMYYSARDGGAVFLDSRRDEMFSDEQIRGMLGGTLFLAAESAAALQARGFGDYLGVRVRERTAQDIPVKGERIFATKQTCNAPRGLMVLTPTDTRTLTHSEIYTLRAGKDYVALYPGLTEYKNALGGTVFVFAGTPRAAFTYVEAFSFLNESRKQQLIHCLHASGHLPVYYPDDAEIYMKVGETDGGLLCAVFNIGLDVLEALPLVCDRPVTQIRRLTADGTFAPCSFKKEGQTLTLALSVGVLEPVILLLS